MYSVPYSKLELEDNYKKYILTELHDPTKRVCNFVELYFINTNSEFEPIQMLLDTGATRSVISSKYINYALNVNCTKINSYCFSKRCNIESSGKIAQLYAKIEQSTQNSTGTNSTYYTPICVEICTNQSTTSLLGMTTLNTLGMTSIDFVNKKIYLDSPENRTFIQLSN